MEPAFEDYATKLEKELAKLRFAGNALAHEMRFMLNMNPERRGGLYESALRGWDEVTGRTEPSLRDKNK